MQIVTSYSVKIKNYNHIFKETISAYRKAPFETQEKCFYKFPSYLRHSAINEAVGKVSSYISNLNAVLAA